MEVVETDALIVGAGPAGLAAAIELRRLRAGKVLVVDREKQAGGIPRQCHHTGFGLSDLHRFMSGPAYAARYVQIAEKHGVDIRTEMAITGWENHQSLRATSPAGLVNIRAKAVLLATGCRERPRAAKLIPGSRPAGIFTTGALQNYVYGQHLPVGKRAVVVGAEHVSFSAVMTLKHARVHVIAMITDLMQHQSFFQYKLISADRYGVPILTNLKVTCIKGKERVEAIEVTNVIDGSVREIECDTVVFTGDWIPDYELAFYGKLDIERRSKSPRVNQRLQTSVRGVFAAGNVIHAAETADIAALSGRYAAGSIQTYLDTGSWPERRDLQIEYGEPILWVSPNALLPGVSGTPHGHFILRVTRLLTDPTIEVWQGQRCLWRHKYGKVVPNLPLHVSDEWLQQVKQTEGPVRIEAR